MGTLRVKSIRNSTSELMILPEYSKARGMALQIFVTLQATCPQILNEASANSSYQAIYIDSSNNVDAGTQIPAAAVSHFYLVNGWHTVGTSLDSNAYTSIMLTGAMGNCWTLDQSGTAFIVSPCNLGSSQVFYVSYISFAFGCLQCQQGIGESKIGPGRCSFSIRAQCHWQRPLSSRPAKPERRSADT